MKTVLLSTILAFILPSLSALAEDWPEWRGTTGQGLAAPGTYATSWSETENITWRTALPGRGWSTPVIVGNQIWLTTAFEVLASEEEAAKKLKANTGNQPLTLLSELRLSAICVDRTTGKILHEVELFKLADPQWVHRLNSYASPSPIAAGGRLYCHFGSFGNACVDMATAGVVWRNTELSVMHENGPGSSPVLWQNRLILHYDGSDQQFIAALDTETGKVAWKTARSGELKADPQLRKAYATPLLHEVNGKTQILSPASDWVYGYDPATGEELWKLSYGALGFSNVARPVAAGDMLYLVTGFMRSEMLGIRLPVGDKPAEILWRQQKSIPRLVSPLLVDGLLYLISDGGIGACLDAQTGDLKWRERLNGDFSASPIFANGYIYACAQDGRTVMLKPGPTFDVVRENKLEGQLFASPIALDNAIYIRTEKALYRIEAK